MRGSGRGGGAAAEASATTAHYGSFANTTPHPLPPPPAPLPHPRPPSYAVNSLYNMDGPAGEQRHYVTIFVQADVPEVLLLCAAVHQPARSRAPSCPPCRASQPSGGPLPTLPPPHTHTCPAPQDTVAMLTEDKCEGWAWVPFRSIPAPRFLPLDTLLSTAGFQL